MALAAVRTSGDLCGKSARPYGRGCRVASGNKGKSVVIQLFPRDETSMVVGNSDSEEQRKTTLRALSLSISGRAILEEQEGRRAIRIDASFCLKYYLPPFFFSLFLPSSTLSSSTPLFPTATAPVFTNILSPHSRSYTIFLNSRESSSVLAIYARNFTTSSPLNSRWRSLSLLSLISRDIVRLGVEQCDLLTDTGWTIDLARNRGKLARDTECWSITHLKSK